MGDDRPVRQLERRQLRVSGRLAQRFSRALAEERDRMPVGGDHLLVVEFRGTKRLLHPATWMHPRALVIAVAHVQRWRFGHHGPPVVPSLMLAVGAEDAASQSRLPNAAGPVNGRTGTKSSLARGRNSDAPLRYGRAAPRAFEGAALAARRVESAGLLGLAQRWHERRASSASAGDTRAWGQDRVAATLAAWPDFASADS